MKNIYVILIATFLSIFFSYGLVNAQSGCPDVNAGPDITIPCNQTCANLLATYFESGNTNSYAVNQIGYTPFSYTAGTSILVNTDDVWSGVINLPFTFCFFGNPYTQLVVGANGLLSFDVSNANQTCAWNTTLSGTLPTTNMYTNSIMGAYHDIDPSLGGQVRYQIIGAAPCRIFVISYNNIPMFDSDFLGSCDGIDNATHQIALYETTNAIEVYMQRKEACTGWNDGLGTVGIQNAAGTVAFTAPGKNNSVWSATNEAWRFTPNGPSIVTVDWLTGGSVIGTGATISVCPTTPTSYTARATYLPCNGGAPIVETDDIFVGVSQFAAQVDSFKNVSCNGTNNGAAYASFNSTSAMLSYGWTPGGTPNSTVLTNAAPGTYIFTATTIENCSFSDTVTIIGPGSLQVVVPDSTFTTCSPPGNAGVLTASATGGNPLGAGYSFAWSNSQTGAVATGLTAGNYTVTLTDGDGCTATDQGTVIYQNVLPNFSPPTLTNLTCNGANNGQIIVNVNNVSPPINFNWSSGLPNNDTVSNLAANTYTVTVSDANSCTASASYTITQPTPVIIGAPAITGATCAGGGSITVSANGGTGVKTLTWSNGQTGSPQTNLAGGTYTLTATDVNGCSATASYNVPNAPNSVVFNAPTIVDVTCNGGSNGSITASASGGVGTINYTWSTTQTGPTINSLVAGTYSVTISDANNCTASTSYIINEPTTIIFGTPTIVDATCSAGGSLAVSATGGTGTITYLWSDSQFGASATNLNPGSYTVTATDQNSCTASASYTVGAAPNLVVISNPNVVDVTCNGGNDGSVSVTVNGGVGAVTVTWSNTQTGNSISGLVVGSYSVTAIDGTGCSASASYTVNEPTALVEGIPTIQNAGCSGTNNGSITANVSGGTPNYTYSWVQASTSQALNGQTINNLGADTYNLTITDNNGCSITTSYSISQAAALTFTQSSTNVSCNGGSDGTATINVTTGTPPYQYNWNGTGPTANPTITGLPAGTVNVTITDANCTETTSLVITEPNPVTTSLVNLTDVSCNNGADGTITVSAAGGTPGYNFVWSNAQTGATATGLAPGSYTVTAADANLCTASQTFTIQNAPAIVLAISGTDATCYQATNGTATVVATGGSGAFTYLWNDGQTTAQAIALGAGYYFVTATDANGCTAVANTFINEPTELIISHTETAVTCPGANDGTITVTATGATPPYTYSATQDFANFLYPTNGVIIGLPPGVYILIVADLNGCTRTDSAIVLDATPDGYITTTDSTSCFGSDYNDGRASIIGTTAQNGPYQFSMDGGPLQFSGDFYNLSAGDHVITAVNNFGCVTEVPVFVNEPLPIVADVVPDSLILPLGQTGSVQVTYLNTSNPSYAWSPAEGLSCIDCPNPSVTVYQNQDYVVTVSAVNGTATCFATAALKVIVLPNLPVYIPNSFSPNGDGNNDVFQIYGEGIKTIDLKIFNRWGELVYESNNQFEGWDGRYKGEMQNPAVFTYYTTIQFLNNKEIERKGTVTIIR